LAKRRFHGVESSEKPSKIVDRKRGCFSGAGFCDSDYETADFAK
jgi:hypothetical protein